MIWIDTNNLDIFTISFFYVETISILYVRKLI